MNTGKTKLLILSAMSLLALASCNNTPQPASSSTPAASSAQTSSQAATTSEQAATTSEQAVTSEQDSQPAVVSEGSQPAVVSEDSQPAVVSEDSQPAVVSEDSQPAESTPIESTGSEDTTPQVVYYDIVDSIDDHVHLVGLPAQAEAGTKIEFSIAVDPGYEFLDRVVARSGDAIIEVELDEDGIYSFTMPEGDVVISAVDQLSSFRLGYDIAEGLDVKAYHRVVESSLAKDEFAPVAGIYRGELVYSSYANDDAYEIAIDAAGRVSLAMYYITDNYGGNPQFTATGSGRVEVRTIGEGEEAKNETHLFLETVLDSNENYSFIAEFIFQEVEIPATETEPAKTEKKLKIVSGKYAAYSTRNYTSGNLAFHEDVAPLTDGFTYVALDDNPDCVDYLEEIYYKVSKTNLLEADVVSFNGEVLEANEDGMYRVLMPYHGSLLSVTSKTRRSPIRIDSGLLDVKAFVKVQGVDGEGNPVTTYEEVTDAPYNEQIFIKVADDTEEAKLRSIKVIYGTGKTDFVGTWNGLTLNDDGYYFSASWAKMSNMDFGMTILVDESRPWIDADEACVGQGKAQIVGSDEAVDLSADIWGNITLGSGNSANTYFYDPEDLDLTTGLADLHSVRGGDPYKVFVGDDGFYAIQLYDNRTSVYNSYVGYIAGEGEKVAFDNLSETGTNSTSNHFALMSAYRTSGTDENPIVEETNVFFADLDEKTGTDEDGVNHDLVIPHVGVEIDVLTDSQDAYENGAIFDIKLDGAIIATYKNQGGKLVAFEKGLTGTFAGEAGEIVSDGVNFKVDNVAPIAFAFGSNSCSWLLDSEDGPKLYVAAFDAENGTYAKIPGKPFGVVLKGQYNGQSISYSSGKLTGSSYYKMILGSSSNPLSFQWENGSAAQFTLDSEGRLFSGTFTAVLSEDGKEAFVSNGSYRYYLSRNITSYSAAAQKIVSFVTATGSISQIIPNNASNGTSSDNILIAEGDSLTALQVRFGKLRIEDGNEGDNFGTDGLVFSVIDEGTNAGTYKINGTSIESVLDIRGEYLLEAEDETVVDAVVGFSTIKLGDADPATFTVVEQDDNSVTISWGAIATEGGKIYRTTYIATLDPVNFEGTISSSTQEVNAGSVASTDTNPWIQSHDALYDKWIWTSPSGKDGMTCWLDITVNLGGTVTFDYDISTEGNWDCMRVVKLFNGGSTSLIADKSYSGTKTGTFTINNVEAGAVIRIGFEKDGSGKSGRDNIIVSNIQVAGIVIGEPEPEPTPAVSYFLVGSMNEWTEADDYKFVKMDEKIENKDQYVINGVHLEAGDHLKIKSGDVWYPAGTDNDFVVETSGTYNIYFAPEGGVSQWGNGYFFVSLVAAD